MSAGDVQPIVARSDSGASTTAVDDGHFVEGVIFFASTISAFLIRNQPSWPTPQGLLFHIHSIFLHLALINGLAFIFFSLIFHRSLAMSRVRRKLAFNSVMFLVVAFMLSAYVELPVFSFVSF
ncbi:unnamed protein product [Spirodela intermedia]|uniref:Uncharacterized protein n=1 Tax=Spirodela intermedia TaxID=51605 RepID=A0A7I8IMN4_SPIIN|nr:unnamed protein product [Spirodela intermedia]CAA6658719.1 unnamed protein product [Spirodela intermedia]